ncbi:MAG: RNA degradosome polyphosphate kinase, partial [Candidatus Dormibacteria bacterium]
MAEQHARTVKRRRQHPHAIAAAAEDSQDPLQDPSCYINRELSWLDFNARVLAEARDPRVPVLERMRFLAITANNLDEFYMIRVASLKRQQQEHFEATHPDRMTATDQLRAVAERSRKLVDGQLACLGGELVPALQEQGVRVVLGQDGLSREEQRICSDFFERQIYPLLTPLAIDPAHPFPYLSNLSLSIAVILAAPGERTPRVARVKVPSSLPRFYRAGTRGPFIPVERIISERLKRLFPGM